MHMTDFSELYDLLARYKLTEDRELRSLSDRNRSNLSARIATYFRDNLKDILALAENSEGVVLRFDKYNPKWGKLDKVSRKAVFYSDVSVALLEGQINVFGVEQLSSRKGTRSRKIPKQVNATNLDGLVTTLLQAKPLVDRGILIPLPADMNIGREQSDIDPSTVYRYNELLATLREDRLTNVVIPVALDHWRIRQQIEEMRTLSTGIQELRPLHIYLPHLSGISIEELIHVREYNYDSFLRFQKAMRKFLTQSAGVKSESAFIELLRHVDHEVRELESKVEQIRKEQSFKGWGIAGGMIASAMTLLVDAELAKYGSAIIGSKTIFDGIKYLKNRAQAHRTLDDSYYYLPYLVRKLRREPYFDPPLELPEHDA